MVVAAISLPAYGIYWLVTTYYSGVALNVRESLSNISIGPAIVVVICILVMLSRVVKFWKLPAGHPVWNEMDSLKRHVQNSQDEAPFFPGRGAKDPIRYTPFLSYKSKDAQAVRYVAEQLISAGVNPWFNEYIIMLLDRTDFQSAINVGTSEATSALVLDSPEYRESEHCLEEVRRLLGARSCETRKILIVHALGDYQLKKDFSELEESLHVSFDNGETTLANSFLILTRLCDFIGIPNISPVKPDSSSPNVYRNRAIALEFDATGWTIDAPGGDHLGWNEFTGPQLSATWGEYSAKCRVDIGPSGTHRPPNQANDDEHKYFDAIAEFAAGYLDGHLFKECVGVHSIRCCDLAQFAVTYANGRIWFRKYSIDLPPFEGLPTLEYAFTFTFSGPFRKFCRHAFLFDRLIASIRRPES